MTRSSLPCLALLAVFGLVACTNAEPSFEPLSQSQPAMNLGWSSSSSVNSRSVAWGDVDGDGDLDLAIGRAGSGRVTVEKTVGGSLVPFWTAAESGLPRDMEWVDWDGDGDMDLYVANDSYLSYLYENIAGALSLAWSTPSVRRTYDVDWADWDGDGDLDLACGNLVQANQVYDNTAGVLTLVWSSPDAAATRALSWTDWDGDGDPDLAVGNDGVPSQIFLNIGGDLVLSATTALSDLTWALALADVDGDGDPDMAIGNDSQPNRLYRNDDGNLNLIWSSPDNQRTWGMGWADWDLDGDMDLGVANNAGPNRVWLNTGGVLSLAWSSPEIDVSTGMAWGDYDADGDPDLAVSAIGAPARVYVNEIPLILASGLGDFATLQAAIDATLDCSSIRVGPGVFSEDLIVDHCVTILGDPSGGTVIQPSSTGFAVSVSAGVLVRMQDLTIDGGTLGFLSNLSGTIELLRVKILNGSGSAIALSGSTVFRGTELELLGNGLGLTAGFDVEVALDHSLVAWNGAAGISITSSVAGNLDFLTVVGNGSDGLKLTHAGSTLTNSIVTHNGSFGVFGSASVRYTDLFSNAGGDLLGPDPSEPSLSFVDPGFVAYSNDGNLANDDFHLASTLGSWKGGAFVADAFDSPLLGTGDPANPALMVEPMPNGCAVNPGRYGATRQASKGASPVTPLVHELETGRCYRSLDLATRLVGLGNTLNLDAGSFVPSSGIAFPAGVVLAGAGPGQTLLQPDPTDPATASLDFSRDYTLRDVELLGVALTQSALGDVTLQRVRSDSSVDIQAATVAVLASDLNLLSLTTDANSFITLQDSLLNSLDTLGYSGYILFEGCSVFGPAVLASTGNLVVRGNRVSGSTALYTSGNAFAEVQSNVFGLGGAGVNGLELHDDGSGGLTAFLRNNTLVAGDMGLMVDCVGSAILVVSSNIFQDATLAAIASLASPSAPNMVLDHNLYFNNLVDLDDPAVVFGLGAVSNLDPLFFDYSAGVTLPANANLHLLPGSPAIDAGNPSVLYLDRDGSPNDIGAFGGPYTPSDDYDDWDGDGYCEFGVDLDGSGFCTEAGEFTAQAQDCDDTNPLVNPGVTNDVVNGIDDNCNGLIDEGTPTDDMDGDGFTELQGDCDDTDPTVYPLAPETADGLDNNCDGVIDEGTVTGDDDGDGYCEGLDLNSDGSLDCGDGSLPGDCNDVDPLMSPGALEIAYDGIDQDCSGADLLDLDGDGFDGPTGVGPDCDDNDASTYPGAVEIADGVDNDCDGTVDEGTIAYDDDGDGYCEGVDLNADGVPDCSDGAFPGDCDDLLPAINPLAIEIAYDGIDQDCSGADWVDVDGDGFDGPTGTGPDCDDNDATTYPGALELPDGLDNDCDGTVDEGTLLYDDEGDGFCEGFDLDGDGVLDCSDGSLPGDCDDTNYNIQPNPAIYDVPYNSIDENCDGFDVTDVDGDGYDASQVGGPDCDDSDAAINPGVPEIPYNGVDEDCSGADRTDVDGDGYDGPSGIGPDCDDNEAAVHPGTTEICNGVDDDCNGQTDEGFDGDGDGIAPCMGDCNDSEFSIHPGADEGCDGLDTDCDGSLGGDELDDDGDGQTECDGDCDDGDSAAYAGATEDCGGEDLDCDGEPSNGFDQDGDGFISCDGDCDDLEGEVFPGAVELCDGVDNNCVDGVDEGFDEDGDGFTSCGGDCDDAKESLNPGIAEDCRDGIDNDCDGVVDSADPDCSYGQGLPYYSGFDCACEHGQGGGGAKGSPLLLLLLGSLFVGLRRMPFAGWKIGPLLGLAMLLTAPRAMASELVLVQQSAVQPDLAEQMAPLLKRLDPAPGADAVVQPLSALRLPVPAQLWLAGAAESRYCNGALRAQSDIVAMIQAGIDFMDFLEEAKAREQFQAAENLLPCADEVLDSGVLWDLFYSAAILAHNAGEVEESVRLFRAAALSNPEGTWDNSYSPAAQQAYLRGREQSSLAHRLPLRLFDPFDLVSELYVDGKVVDLSDPRFFITADRHLVQLRTRHGGFLSLQVKVESGNPAQAEVLGVSGEGLGELLFLGEGPTVEGLVASLLAAHLEGLEDGSSDGAWKVWLVDRDKGLVRVFDGETGRFLGPATPVQGMSGGGRGKKPRSAAAGKPGGFGVAALGGLLYLPRLQTPAAFHGAISLLLSGRLTKGLYLDGGLHSGLRKLDAATFALEADRLSWTPILRVGMHYELGSKAVHPYLGAVATVGLHKVGGVGVGPAFVGGLLIQAKKALHLRVDVLAGYNQGLMLNLGAGIELRL